MTENSNRIFDNYLNNSGKTITGKAAIPIFEISAAISILGIILIVSKFYVMPDFKLSGYTFLITFFAIINTFYSRTAFYKHVTINKDCIQIRPVAWGETVVYAFDEVSSYRIIKKSGSAQFGNEFYQTIFIWYTDKRKVELHSKFYSNFQEMVSYIQEQMDIRDKDLV